MDIDTAPVKQGAEFGNCLLLVAEPDQYTVGYWDGSAWYTDTDLLIHPILWGILPLLC